MALYRSKRLESVNNLYLPSVSFPATRSAKSFFSGNVCLISSQALKLLSSIRYSSINLSRESFQNLITVARIEQKIKIAYLSALYFIRNGNVKLTFPLFAKLRNIVIHSFNFFQHLQIHIRLQKQFCFL